MPDNRADTIPKEITEHAEYLRGLYTARNAFDNWMENIYLLKWQEEGKVRRQLGENAKITLHPGARNATQGAWRLIVAADPEFSVPMDVNQLGAKSKADKLEKLAKAMWMASGRLRKRPVHYDVALSCLLFAEMHIEITKTADMVEFARGASKAAQVRAEEAAKATPYLFEVHDPRTGFPEMDNLGLTAFYREFETSSGKILDEFGDAAKSVLKDDKRYTNLTLCKFWDLENYWIWIKGRPQPLSSEAHGLPYIPVSVQLGEGSSLFPKPEDQRQPFLYTEYRSGIWNRLNLIMSVIHTMVFAIGSNPMFVYQTNTPGKKPAMDFSRPGGVLTIEQGESFQPMVKNIIDASMIQLFETDEKLEAESTIFSQALGEPLGGNAPFSMVALLHQAGRLPLVAPLRMAEWAIADAVKMGIRWIKQDGRKSSASYEDISSEITPKEIPARFELNCKLDLALPQDKAQMVQVATQATGGDHPLASQRWAREELMGIGQSDEMMKEIWREQSRWVQFAKFVEDMMTRKQQMSQPQPPPGGQAPGQPTPEQIAQMGNPVQNAQPMPPIPSGQMDGPPPEEMMP
jgi:hypothetical protein